MSFTEEDIRMIIKKYHNEISKLVQDDLKLKTLREIEKTKDKVKIKELKQEAIKWIKFIRKDVNEMHYKYHDSEGALYHKGQINWIEQFFNIKL